MSDGSRSRVAVVERLGFGPQEKLLVINADDAGMCCAVNDGIERTFNAGLVTSCTVMTPCPWFGDFAARVRRNPTIRVGVHLTATSEWRHYRWGSVCPRAQVPSLLDEEGYFHATLEAYHEHAVAREVELEFRAQIERCLEAGLHPTHLDSHMGVYHFREDLFDIALRLAEEYQLTLRDGLPDRLRQLQSEGWCVVDLLFFDTHDVPLEQRRAFYREFFDGIQPGLTELVVHPAEPTAELRSIGGMWQRRGFDLELFTNPETEELLRESGITLIGYDRLQAATAERRGWSG